MHTKKIEAGGITNLPTDPSFNHHTPLHKARKAKATMAACFTSHHASHNGLCGALLVQENLQTNGDDYSPNDHLSTMSHRSAHTDQHRNHQFES